MGERSEFVASPGGAAQSSQNMGRIVRHAVPGQEFYEFFFETLCGVMGCLVLDVTDHLRGC
jgi:hypothetical protein